jgi:phage/plasmid-associated DNA primase
MLTNFLCSHGKFIPWTGRQTIVTAIDPIAQFVEQECDIDPETKYSASKLCEAYRHYCRAIGRKPQSTNAFKKALEPDLKLID